MKRNKAREGPEIMTLQDVAEYLNCPPCYCSPAPRSRQTPGVPARL
jgi:hypothetical protein